MHSNFSELLTTLQIAQRKKWHSWQNCVLMQNTTCACTKRVHTAQDIAICAQTGLDMHRFAESIWRGVPDSRVLNLLLYCLSQLISKLPSEDKRQQMTAGPESRVFMHCRSTTERHPRGWRLPGDSGSGQGRNTEANGGDLSVAHGYLMTGSKTPDASVSTFLAQGNIWSSCSEERIK